MGNEYHHHLFLLHWEKDHLKICEIATVDLCLCFLGKLNIKLCKSKVASPPLMFCQ